MAHHEKNREDLLAEGVNLPERGRITGPDGKQWVAGWRNGHSLSLFVNQDPVFHFNNLGELRRAYIHGCRLSVKERTLVKLVRASGEGARVSLTQEPLTDSQTERIRNTLRNCLDELDKTLHPFGNPLPGAINIETIGIDPDRFCQRLSDWITVHASSLAIAKMPNVE